MTVAATDHDEHDASYNQKMGLSNSTCCRHLASRRGQLTETVKRELAITASKGANRALFSLTGTCIKHFYYYHN